MFWWGRFDCTACTTIRSVFSTATIVFLQRLPPHIPLPLARSMSLFPVPPMLTGVVLSPLHIVPPLVTPRCRTAQEGWGYLSMNLRLHYHNNRHCQEKFYVFFHLT